MPSWETQRWIRLGPFAEGTHHLWEKQAYEHGAVGPERERECSQEASGIQPVEQRALPVRARRLGDISFKLGLFLGRGDPYLTACGTLAPLLGMEPIPPSLEGEVLTTGPPGKSLSWVLNDTGESRGGGLAPWNQSESVLFGQEQQN